MAIPGLGAVVLGAVTTGVATFFQLTSAKITSRRAHQVSELKRGEEIFNKISVSMDSLAFLSTEVMYSLVFRYRTEEYTPEDQKMWDSYLAALAQWKGNKTKNLAEMKEYFGPGCLQLLEEIQNDLYVLECQLMATYFNRQGSRYFLVDKVGNKNDFRKKYFKYRRPLDKKMTQLSADMLGLIQREEVGVLG